jgi:hypothetical protein
VDANENLPEDNLDDVSVDESEDNESDTVTTLEISEEQLKYKNTMKERLAKMQEQVNKIKEQLKM